MVINCYLAIKRASELSICDRTISDIGKKSAELARGESDMHGLSKRRVIRLSQPLGTRFRSKAKSRLLFLTLLFLLPIYILNRTAINTVHKTQN